MNAKFFLFFILVILAPDLLSDNNNSIETREKLFNKIYKITGFKEVKSFNKMSLSDSGAKSYKLKDSLLPFLHEIYSEQPVWEVNLDSIYLDLPRWHKDFVEKYNPRDFKIIIDSLYGEFVMAYSVKNSDSIKPYYQNSLQLQKSLEGQEVIYKYCPDSLSNITLFDALDAASGSNPLKANELIVYLVLRSFNSRPAIPVWIVIGRGIPPVEIFRGATCLKSGVNAITGELMFVASERL